MGRKNHTKRTRVKAIVATLAVALAGAITGSAMVLAGGNAQAATDTNQCETGQQAVESLVPLRGEGETICLTVSESIDDGSRVDPNYSRVATEVIREAASMIDTAEQREATAQEGETECYAMQLTQRAAAELGLDEVYGASLAELNWDFNHGSRAGSIYDSPDCHEGGLFDLDNDTLWH